MDESPRVLRRLERIEALDRRTVPAEQLLGELRALVREAEEWARLDGDHREQAALPGLRAEVGGMS